MSTSAFRLITSIAIFGACASATSTAAPPDASVASVAPLEGFRAA